MRTNSYCLFDSPNYPRDRLILTVASSTYFYDAHSHIIVPQSPLVAGQCDPQGRSRPPPPVPSSVGPAKDSSSDDASRHWANASVARRMMSPGRSVPRSTFHPGTAPREVTSAGADVKLRAVVHRERDRRVVLCDYEQAGVADRDGVPFDSVAGRAHAQAQEGRVGAVCELVLRVPAQHGAVGLLLPRVPRIRSASRRSRLRERIPSPGAAPIRPRRSSRRPHPRPRTARPPDRRRSRLRTRRARGRPWARRKDRQRRVRSDMGPCDGACENVTAPGPRPACRCPGTGSPPPGRR